jgi:hypothetical protein
MKFFKWVSKFFTHDEKTTLVLTIPLFVITILPLIYPNLRGTIFAYIFGAYILGVFVGKCVQYRNDNKPKE